MTNAIFHGDFGEPYVKMDVMKGSSEMPVCVSFFKQIFCIAFVICVIMSACGDDKKASAVRQINVQTNSVENESVAQRLKRLKYSIEPCMDGKFQAISFPGNDGAVIVSSEPTRDSRGKVTLAIGKLFAPYFLCQDDEFKRFLAKCNKRGKTAWLLSNVLPLKYCVCFLMEVNGGVTDDELIRDISCVATTKLPLTIDPKYQEKWSILTAIKTFQIGMDESYSQERILTLTEPYLEQCPYGFVESFKNLVKVVASKRNARTKNNAEEFGRAGLMLGSLDKDNPTGSAITGALLGGLIGLCADMDETDHNIDEIRNAFDRVQLEAQKVGVNLDDKSAPPLPY